MIPDRLRDHPHASDDALLDLLHGPLPVEHRDRVVSHLLGCAACDARFQALVGDHERGRAMAAGALTTPATGTNPDERTAMSARPFRKAASRTLAAAAALLVVLGGGWWVAMRGVGPGPASRAHHEWLPAETSWGSLREAADAGPDSTILAGVAAYEHRDLRRAEALLRGVRSEGAYELVRRLYLANTLVALGRSADALPVLTGTYWLLPEPWRGEWDWTFMVACAQTGQEARADSLLEVLRRRRDAIGARARTLEHDARDHH